MNQNELMNQIDFTPDKSKEKLVKNSICTKNLNDDVMRC